MSKVCNGFSAAIGKTPLIKINSLSRETGSNIYAKAEFMNPGGSVKDRAALWLIEDAERRGQLKAGGTVVEGTAGNTGIGLAHICRAKGYNCVIFMPNTQSKGKIDLLTTLGADVRPVPAVPYENPANFNHQAKNYALENPGAVWVNQFDNRANRQAHIDSTGPEIWNQLDGKIDAWTCATGTGGTFAGVARYLHDVSGGQVKNYLADPEGSVIYNYLKTGKLGIRTGSSATEGIGQGRVTENLKTEIELVHDALLVPDTECISMLYRVLDEEGLYLGLSTALNVAAAYRVAKMVGPGKNIVTILCDGAYRYSDRLFNKSWLESKNLYSAIPEHLRRYVC